MNLKQLELELKNQKMILTIINSHVNELARRMAKLEKEENQK